MVMPNSDPPIIEDKIMTGVLADIADLRVKIDGLEDRTSVLEIVTAPHEFRLEDLEMWKEKVKDDLERY